MEQTWFKLARPGNQGMYGFGTEDEADAWCDIQNRLQCILTRNVGNWTAEPITDYDEHKRDEGFDLYDDLQQMLVRT